MNTNRFYHRVWKLTAVVLIMSLLLSAFQWPAPPAQEGEPVPTPTATPVAEVVEEPTAEPVVEPTVEVPTIEVPTVEIPTVVPTVEEPTAEPTVEVPTVEVPTAEPSITPSETAGVPTETPTLAASPTASQTVTETPTVTMTPTETTTPTNPGFLSFTNYEQGYQVLYPKDWNVLPNSLPGSYSNHNAVSILSNKESVNDNGQITFPISGSYIIINLEYA